MFKNEGEEQGDVALGFLPKIFGTSMISKLAEFLRFAVSLISDSAIDYFVMLIWELLLSLDNLIFNSMLSSA